MSEIEEILELAKAIEEKVAESSSNNLCEFLVKSHLDQVRHWASRALEG